MSEKGADITDVLLKELFIIDRPPFPSREDLFDYMAGRFEEKGIVTDKEAFKRSLEHREALGSTYMGNFIAIPHGQCEEVLKPGAGFIRCSESFQYQSAGEEGPVKYVFVLAVSNVQKDDQHLRILASLAGYLMKDEFCSLMEHAQSYEEMMEGIRQLEGKS